MRKAQQVMFMADIPLDGFIDKPRVDWVISRLAPGDRLVVNSAGGNLLEAIRLADHVRKNNVNTHVFSTGLAHSSAALVYAAGMNRTAGKNAQFMLHPADDKPGDKSPSAGTSLFLNKLIGYGVKGSPALIQAGRENLILDYGSARTMNLVNMDDLPYREVLGPLE